MPTQTCKKSLAGISAILALLLLAACDKRQEPDPESEQPAAVAAGALESETETLEISAAGCEGEDCASVAVTREVFAQRPALNEAVLQQLLRQLLGYGEEKAPAGSLEQAAEDFLEQAAQVPGESAAPWQLTGDAKRLGRRGDLLTVEISSYAYMGGAHGMPISRWLNWDLAADKVVKLEDVIRPEQENAFWERARQAHERWLEKQDNANEDFRRIWPFQRSEDFRFNDEGLVLLYNVYVLGPYVLGQVQLTLPWEELRDLIREPYLPAP